MGFEPSSAGRSDDRVAGISIAADAGSASLIYGVAMGNGVAFTQADVPPPLVARMRT
jgi:hypothetical protein